MPDSNTYAVDPEPIGSLSEKEMKTIRLDIGDLIAMGFFITIATFIVGAIVTGIMAQDEHMLRYLNDHVSLVFVVGTLVGIVLLIFVGSVTYSNRKIDAKKRNRRAILISPTD